MRKEEHLINFRNPVKSTTAHTSSNRPGSSDTRAPQPDPTPGAYDDAGAAG